MEKILDFNRDRRSLSSFLSKISLFRSLPLFVFLIYFGSVVRCAAQEKIPLFFHVGELFKKKKKKKRFQTALVNEYLIIYWVVKAQVKPINIDREYIICSRQVV